MKFNAEITGGHGRRGLYSPAVLLFLLANVGGAASASIERKRLTVNTDSQRSSDPFGLANPFGVERNLFIPPYPFDDGCMSMDMCMCMCMCMPMCMSMPMDVPMVDVVPVNGLNQLVNPGDFDIAVEADNGPDSNAVTPEVVVDNVQDSVSDPASTSNNAPDTANETQNSPAQSELIQDNTPETTTETTTENTPVSNQAPSQTEDAVRSDDSLSCPSFQTVNMNEFSIEFAYEVTGVNVDDIISDADAAVLGGLSTFVSCDSASRKLAEIISKKRSLRSDERQLDELILREINIASEVSDEYTCTSQNGACTVVTSILSMKTDDDSVTQNILKRETLPAIKASLSGVSLSYTSMESLSTGQSVSSYSSDEGEEESDEVPNVSVSAKNTDQPAGESTDTSSKAGLNSAATGALVAGAFAAVLGAVFVFRKRRASSSEVEYFGEDTSDDADVDREAVVII